MKRAHSIYLDHAATTPVAPEVLKAMQPFFSLHAANPSALYKEAQVANGALNDARRVCADSLNAQPDTIVFTSGGTEANNLAIQGIAKKHVLRGRHFITTAIEHHSVLRAIEKHKQWGFKVTVIPVDKNGLVRPENVIKAIRPDTILISIMYANNEIGSIEPVAEIGRQVLRYRKDKKTMYPFLHTDACQAAGYLNLDVEKLHVDLMSVNGGKIYGPKGTGFLYVRRGVKLEPLMYGGSQEKNIRAGTENVPGVIGLAKALELCQKERKKETQELADYFWKKLQKAVPGVQLNGPEIGESRLPNNLNVIFPGVDGEALVIYLDSLGIMCSTGSACTAVSSEPSHVLKAIGRSAAHITSSVRFTLGKGTSKSDIDYTIRSLQTALKLIKRA